MKQKDKLTTDDFFSSPADLSPGIIDRSLAAGREGNRPNGRVATEAGSVALTAAGPGVIDREWSPPQVDNGASSQGIVLRAPTKSIPVEVQTSTPIATSPPPGEAVPPSPEYSVGIEAGVLGRHPH